MSYFGSWRTSGDEAACGLVSGPSGHVAQCGRELLPDAGDERHLDLRVAASLRGAQPADAVHQAGEVVCLEGQDPLPIAQAEGAGGVRLDVGELPPQLAVLGEQRGTLFSGEQVPLRGPNERIDAQVL